MQLFLRACIMMSALWLALPAGAIGVATVTVGTEPLFSVASELGPNPGVFKFTRSGDTSSPLSVSFTLSGSAVQGVDYLIWETKAQFAAGADTAFVAFLPVNDTLQEGDETVTLTLSPGAGYTVGAPQSATIVIQDVFVPGATGVFDDFEGLRKDIGYLDATVANGQLNIVLGINTPIGGQINSIYIWLDTDQNPATGDFRPGYIGAAEYRIQLTTTLGISADYQLTRLPLSFQDCTSSNPTEPPECEHTIPILTEGLVAINGNFVTAHVPLNLIGNSTAVDVFATTISPGTEAAGLSGNGDRIPEYGVLDSLEKLWCADRERPSFVRSATRWAITQVDQALIWSPRLLFLWRTNLVCS